MSEATIPARIHIPRRAAERINEIVTRRGALEVELQNAVALVLAALEMPEGSQIEILPNGDMVAVAPPTPAAE